MSKKKAEIKMKSKAKKKDLKEFDKYFYYKKSVQSPATDVEFLEKTYKELKGKTPKTLREDFCGTFSISCEWVKLDKDKKAIGVDYSSEPIEYGKANYMSLLSYEQQKQLNIIQGNVLEPHPKADVVCAQNFSYYIFKQRDVLRSYYKNVYETLNKGGIFVCDSFGGSQCQEANEEETEHDKFSYFWDQDSYDPITNYAQFYIHFKRKGEKRREKVFSYDWRMWTIPEIREIMQEAGFKTTHVYWEGTDKNGEGDGEFSRVEKGEECESWIAYIVAEK